jgi:hypothetical protein
LNALQDFLIVFGDPLQLSLSALFTQGVRIANTVVRAIDPTFELE